MATRWYRTGQISATNGSRTITGTGTLWVSGNSLKPEAGDIFTVDFSKFYEVEGILADDSLVLYNNWGEADLANSPYAIVRNASVGINTRVANMVTQALSQKQLMLDEFNVWLTEQTLDTVPIHDAYGNVLSFKPLPKLIKEMEDLIGSVPDITQYVTLARRWANEAEDVEIDPTNNPGEFSSYHWSKKSEGFVALSRQWSNADRNVQPDPTNFPNEFSSRHWSLESASYTDINRRWANETRGTLVDPTNFPNQYSGLHYSTVASEWSTKASQWSDNAKDAEVESGRYSARHWSVISQEWATTAIDTEVSGGLFSSLHYADLSRKWSNTAHGTQVDPTGFPNQFSGRHWSTESQNFATTSQTHRNKAQEWAENPENDPVETGQFSALHWSAKASAFATTAEGHKNNAELARNAAQGFRDEAEGFRDEAEGFRDGAAAQVEQARKWATNDYNVPPDSTNFPGQFSARHWALYAQYFASQAFVSGGTWTPAAGAEYPTPSSASQDTIWIIQFASASTTYTFTSGDLNGVTVFNGDYLFWDGGDTAFEHIPTPVSAAILSVNGKTGSSVIIEAADVPHASTNVGAELTRIAPLADGALQRTGGTVTDLVVGTNTTNGGKLEFVPDPDITGANNVIAEIVGREMQIYGNAPVDINVRFQNRGTGRFHLDVEGRATFTEVIDVTALGPGSHATLCLHDSTDTCAAIMYTPTGQRDLHLETRAADGTTVGGSFVLRHAGTHELTGTLKMMANASEGGQIELQADPQNPNTGDFTFDVAGGQIRLFSNGTDNTTFNVSNIGTGLMNMVVEGAGTFGRSLSIDHAADQDKNLLFRNTDGTLRARIVSVDTGSGGSDLFFESRDPSNTSQRHAFKLDYDGFHTLSGGLNISTYLQADRNVVSGGTGTGQAALTTNDGHGNANLAFNHTNGMPDNTNTEQSSYRVRADCDSNPVSMLFQARGSTTRGTDTALDTYFGIHAGADNSNRRVHFNQKIEDSNSLEVTGVDYYYRDATSTISITARKAAKTVIDLWGNDHTINLTGTGFKTGDTVIIRNVLDTNGTTTINNVGGGTIYLPDSSSDTQVTLSERGTVELKVVNSTNFVVTGLNL